MQPPVDRKGRSTLDAPVRLDEEVEFDPESGKAFTHREPFRSAEERTALATPDITKMLPDKRRRVLAQLAIVRMQEGDHIRDVAEDLGVPVSTLTGYVTTYKRSLKVDEIDHRLDRIAVPLATDNLIHGLIAGDKDYTLETLKGRGKFRRFSNADETVHHDLPELRISFEMPSAGNAPLAPEQIAMGKVVGRAALPAPASAGEQLQQQVLDAEYQVEQHGKAQPKRSEP